MTFTRYRAAFDFLLLDEAITSGAVIIIVSEADGWLDGWAEMLLDQLSNSKTVRD